MQYTKIVEISIHAPHSRCDNLRKCKGKTGIFQSTHLIRGATLELVSDALAAVSISIHAPHSRCDRTACKARRRLSISIHAPHSRCDQGFYTDASHAGISIHAPHSRCDSISSICRSPHNQYFNPRTSFEVRPILRGDMKTQMISIHAPHSRCDGVLEQYGFVPDISIHAPHSRCDDTEFDTTETTSYFNPRTSFEVRPGDRHARHDQDRFQSTHLIRGATD